MPFHQEELLAAVEAEDCFSEAMGVGKCEALEARIQVALKVALKSC